MYLQYSRPRYLSSLSKCLEGVVHISTSIFVGVPYLPLYSTDKFISCVVPRPSQWFFHLGEEIVIAKIDIGWVRWMFQNFPLPEAQEVRGSSSGMSPYIIMKNDGDVHLQVSSFSPEHWTNMVLQERAVVGNVYHYVQYYPINGIRHNQHHLHSTLCTAHFLWTRRIGMLACIWFLTRLCSQGYNIYLPSK